MCDEGVLKTSIKGEGKGKRRYIIDFNIINSSQKSSTKVCKTCNKTLNIEDFYDNGYRRIFNNCKKCTTKEIQMRQINKIIKKYETPIKSCKDCNNDKKCSICTTEYKILNGINVGKNQLKEYLRISRNYTCEKCKNSKWMGKIIPLDVHHIDANRKNNKQENLLLLCKNCHALTDNYCFKGARRKIY